MKNFKDSTLALVDGHVLIKDIDTGDVLLDKHNAINFENIAVAIASLLGGAIDTATSAGFTSTKMAFGNGGPSIDGTGTDSYKTPNYSASGTLYNVTYTKDVSDNTDLDNPVTVVKYDAPYTVTLLLHVHWTTMIQLQMLEVLVLVLSTLLLVLVLVHPLTLH